MDENLLKTQTLATQEIKRRSVVGAIALTSRTFILQIVALVATFILTILLDPATFGIFFVVTAAINFLGYFSDIGLAAALIQKREEPTRTELTTTFTIQQLLVGATVVIALILSHEIANFQKFGPGALFLFRALAISFLLSSLKTIPSVLLERKLDFQKLVIPQIVETLVFYMVAIFLALKGAGVISFAWAALSRGISGTLFLYIIAPWKPGIRFDIESAKKLLSFGLPYQTNSFLALVKDDLLTVYLGFVLPLSAVGYIGWAKKWAEIALRLIMDNIIKVTFPAYSRLQHEPELLAKAISKSVFFLSLLTFPIAIGMMFMIRPFIEVVPKYIKWEPALFSFYLFTLSAVLATLSSPLVNALNAIGKVKYALILMIFWTTLTWILVPLLVNKYGFNGVAMAAAIIGMTSFIPLQIVKQIVRLNFTRQILKPAITTLFMVLVLSTIHLIVSSAILKLIFGIGFGIVSYLLITYLFMRQEILPYLAFLRKKPNS